MKAARNELEKALLLAAKNGDLAEVERLAAVPVDVNCRDEVCTPTDSPLFSYRRNNIYADAPPPLPASPHAQSQTHSQHATPQYLCATG